MVSCSQRRVLCSCCLITFVSVDAARYGTRCKMRPFINQADNSAVFCLLLTLTPINLLCVCMCVCVCGCVYVCVKRWQKTDGMSSCPPLPLRDLTCSLHSSLFNELHSPEKFLETSMVVKMAPCGGERREEEGQMSKSGDGELKDRSEMCVRRRSYYTHNLT